MVARLRSGSLGLLCTNYMPYAPSPKLPSHKIMPSTCQTIHYDASQYRVYIPVHYFSLVIPSPPQKYPCLPCSLPSLLPCSSIRSVAPSFLRSLSPSFLSLAPSMPRSSLPRSFRSRRDTYVGFWLYDEDYYYPSLNLPSLPPLPLPRCLTSSLPSSLPLAPCSLRPSHLLFSLAPSLSHIIASSLPPAPCSLRPSHLLFSLSPSLPLATRLPPAVQLNIHRVCILCSA